MATKKKAKKKKAAKSKTRTRKPRQAAATERNQLPVGTGPGLDDDEIDNEGDLSGVGEEEDY